MNLGPDLQVHHCEGVKDNCIISKIFEPRDNHCVYAANVPWNSMKHSEESPRIKPLVVNQVDIFYHRLL